MTAGDDNNMKITVPASFENEVNNYLTENDPVGCFIKDCLIITNNNKDIIQSNDLFTEFKIYSNNPSMHASKFKAILEKNNLKSVRCRTGVIYNNLSFKYRPSQQNPAVNINNQNIDFVDDN